MTWVLCSDCNRVLLAEHGPTCPECMAAQRRRDEEEAEEPSEIEEEDNAD